MAGTVAPATPATPPGAPGGAGTGGRPREQPGQPRGARWRPGLLAAATTAAACSWLLQAGVSTKTALFQAPWLCLAVYGLALVAPPRQTSAVAARERTATARPRPEAAFGRGSWACLAAMMAMALALRLYELGSRSLWFDEAISVWLARLPWRSLVPVLATNDGNPPLYFALLHLWLAFGDGEFSVRLLSVLFSLAAVALAVLLGHALAGRGAGLLAGCFVALSPAQVHYGQEARTYPLVAACTLAATYAALRTLRLATIPHRSVSGAQPAARPVSPRGGDAQGRAGFGLRTAGLGLRVAGWPALWGVLMAALAAMHHTAALVGLALALAVAGAALVRRSGALLIALVTAAGTAAVLWAPLAPLFVTQSRQVSEHFWIPPPRPAYVVQSLLEISVGVPPPTRQVPLSDPVAIRHLEDAIPALLAVPRIGPLRAFSESLSGQEAVALLWMGALAFAGSAVLGARRHRASAALLALVVVLPVVVLLLVSVRHPLFLPRTVMGSGTVALVAIAVACATLPWGVRLPAAALVLVVEVLGLGQYWWYPSTEAWSTVAGRLAAEAHAGDLVLVNGRWSQVPLDFYLQRLGAPALVEHGVPRDFGEGGKPEPVTSGDDLPRLRQLAAGRDHLWLVLSHQFETDPDGLTRQALEADFHCFDVWPYQGVTLHLFTRC